MPKTLLLISALAVVAACHPSSDSAPPPTDTTIPATSRGAQSDSAPPLAQDSVVAMLETGCAGGVTGGGRGSFVTADGRFYRYQQHGAPPNAKRELTFVRRDSAAAAALVGSAEREGIARVKFSEPGNMTCHLTLARGGTSSEIAWPLGATPAAISKLLAVAKALETAAADR